MPVFLPTRLAENMVGLVIPNCGVNLFVLLGMADTVPATRAALGTLRVGVKTGMAGRISAVWNR